MFDFIENAVSNVFDIGESLIYGELPSKRQLSQFVSDGVSLYSISEATGIAVDVLEDLMEDS